MSESIVISAEDWQGGMADGPNLGVAMLKNIAIDALTGALVPQYAPTQLNQPSSTQTFTWNTGTNSGTVGGAFAAMVTGQAVTVSTTGGLPSGLVANTTYYIIRLSSSSFQLASTLANALATSPISVTTTGTGVQTMATIDLGTVMSIVNAGAYQFVQDSNGRVWYNISQTSILYLVTGNTLTNAAGNGIIGFKVSDGSASYLFVFRNAVVDVLDVSTNAKINDPVGNSSWSSAWQNLNSSSGSGATHYAIVGQDNIIYFTDSRYVGSILEKPGSVFAPGTPATYTFNNQALRLPQGEIAAWLEQLGLNLLTAGQTYNQIYPWDRVSVSFGFPLICPEAQIFRLQNIGNTVYILAGNRGNVYKTQGYVVTIARKLSEYMTMGASNATQITWGGIGSKNGALIFGVSCASNSANSGVYMLFPDGRLTLDNQLFQGGAAVPALLTPTSQFYLLGGAGELSTVSTSRYGSLSKSIIQSKLYHVGSKTEKASFSQVELQLNQPSTNGSQVRIGYRPDTVSAFTVLATFTMDGTNTSFQTDTLSNPLTDLENVQFQAELSGSGDGGNALAVMSININP